MEYCYETLTNTGGNSWLGMIEQNATMTMESWQQAPFQPQGGGTFSHPWTAAPAYVIPRFLMGEIPLLMSVHLCSLIGMLIHSMTSFVWLDRIWL